MQITISGNITIKSELTNYIKEELQKETNKYFSTAIEGNVHFSKQGDFIRANIVINEGSKRDITIKSNAESKDVKSAFELALIKVSKQLKKYNRKLKEYRRQVSKSKEENQIPEFLTAQNYYISDNEIIDEDFIDDYMEDEIEIKNKKFEKKSLNIVSEKQISIETLTVKDAIMKMDLTGTPALVFKNKDNGRINVVYRRKDGNVSWIDTKEK